MNSDPSPSISTLVPYGYDWHPAPDTQHRRRTPLRIVSSRGCAVVGLIQLLVWPTYAQRPSGQDFDLVANGPIYALAVQPDGKILVGGSFTVFAGQTNDGVVRLNTDGTLDSGFFHGSGNATPWVYSLTLQPDGKILVGGTFTTVGGQPCTNFGRLLSDGSLDREFNTGADGMISAIVLQQDGGILVAGDFGRLGGQSCTNLGRLDTQGGLDSSFKAALTGAIYSLAIQPDGKILTGGAFQDDGGQSTVSLLRLDRDGSVDRDFSPGTFGVGVYGEPVSSVALQRDGRILVGGSLTSIDGLPRLGMARLNADGTPDESFDAQLGPLFSYSPLVFSVAIQTDGKVLTGGMFSAAAGQPCTNTARLNPDGTLNTRFDLATGVWMGAVAIQADGKVLLSDPFDFISIEPRNRLVRLSDTAPTAQNLNYSGSTVTWRRTGAGPEVWRTTFEVSTNGSDWSLLGAGTRIAGGWEITNASLPSSGMLRARGFTSGGYQNASSWFIETRLDLGESTCPVIGLSNGTFGIGTNGFGFTITGSSASSVVVEASANLMQWLPVETNYFGSGSWHFLDPSSPQFPHRFYRVRQWP